MNAMEPCPFCGSKDQSLSVFGGRASFGCWESASLEIVCNGCYVEFWIPVRITEKEENSLSDQEIYELTAERGIKRWNTRFSNAEKIKRGCD